MAETASNAIPETVEEALRLWDAGEPVTTVSMGGLGEPYEQCIQNLAFELMREWHALPWPTGGDDASVELRATLRESSDRISAELNKTHGFSGAQVGAAGNLAAIVCRQGYREALSHPDVADRLITVVKKAPEWPTTHPERRCVMASEPTRGPYDLTTDSTLGGAEWPSAFFGTTPDDPDGYDPCLLICSFDDTDCSLEEAIANARLVKAAFIASTAARDLGFDAIGAIEAAPAALHALDIMEWCVVRSVARIPVHHCPSCDQRRSEGHAAHCELSAALCAARKRGDA